MSKSVMISIKPRWCELIASGAKTVEIRKSRPKTDTPFRCYIYESKGDEKAGNEDYTYVKAGNGRQKVIGEFICDAIYSVWAGYTANYGDDRLTFYERETYLGSNMGFGWHISDLKIYDKPKELSQFVKCGAPTFDELDNELCSHCEPTDYGEKTSYYTPSGVYSCEGAWCKQAYDAYLDDENFRLYRPPQSWCYAEEIL